MAKLNMELSFDKSLLQPFLEKFEHIYIHEDSILDDVAQRFLQFFPPNKISIINDLQLPQKNLGSLSANDFDQSKKNILVKPFKGSFFKQCPGSKPGLVCCNYFVLNLGLQCDMNCSYCYLQSYINTPFLTVYSNIDQALEELKVVADSHPEKKYRVGTGETIDSLSLDPLTMYSHKLIDFFKDYPQWTLELKTKSSHINQFIDHPHARNILISWSINPQPVISSEEHETASLKDRLAAAHKCLEKKFQIAFHIDPMIYHADWQKNYQQLINDITQQFTPDEINHISIGTLRFQPQQRHTMRERFGMSSMVTSAEMFKSTDGKLRYDQRLRQEMYTYVLEQFKKHSPLWRVVLCMETPESWVNTMDGSPRQDQKIGDLFAPLPKQALSKRNSPTNLKDISSTNLR